jgi:hypothetical protein
MNHPDLTAIRDRSARLRSFVTALLVVLTLLLLLERFGAAGLHALAHGGDSAALRVLAGQALAAVPDVLYLLALAGVRRALGEFATGTLVARVVPDLLDRVGRLLAISAVLSLCVVPGLQRALGVGPAWWIAFDVATAALGALGLSLTIVAGVLRRAASLQSELDQIF